MTARYQRALDSIDVTAGMRDVVDQLDVSRVYASAFANPDLADTIHAGVGAMDTSEASARGRVHQRAHGAVTPATCRSWSEPPSIVICRATPATSETADGQRTGIVSRILYDSRLSAATRAESSRRSRVRARCVTR